MADYINVLADTPRGKLTFRNDALVIESKVYEGKADCPEVCFHTPNDGGLGKISCRQPRNGVWKERMTMIASEGDGFAFHMDPPGDGSDGEDRDMKRMLDVHWQGVRYAVPIVGASVPSPPDPPGPARVGEMWSPEGNFVTKQQGDGNFVTYDTSAHPWKPVWSSWHGRIA